MILRLNVRFAAILLALLCLAPCGALSAGLTPLPMNQFMAGPVPKNVNYRKSNTFYQDDSISVKISAGTYQGVRYTTARVKIAHASQLRAVSAQQVRNPRAGFGDSTYNTATGAQIAQAVNAVVGINGDYFITDDKCQVMMRQCKQIRNRENHVFDKGYLLSEEKELPMSEKKRNRLRKRVMNTSFDFSAVMMGLCFVLAFIVFMFAGSFYDIAVSQMGALALTFIILILQSIRFVRQINVARYLKNKRSILVCILGMGSVVYAFMVAYLQPVEDWWYYLGSLICLVAASAMSIDLILRYNETSTRPLPSFYSRKGGDDRA